MADAASADASSAESADAARASASVDARAVAAFLLDGRHLCSAFELYMDLLASSADAAQGRPDAASALARLDAHFADARLYPPASIASHAATPDVPALRAAAERAESAVAVAEYDARVAREDLERVTRERDDARRELDDARRELTRRDASETRDAARASAEDAPEADPRRTAAETSSPPTGIRRADEDPSSITAVSASADPLDPLASPAPLPPPDDAERLALDAMIDEYLRDRNYRAARLALREETNRFAPAAEAPNANASAAANRPRGGERVLPDAAADDPPHIKPSSSFTPSSLPAEALRRVYASARRRHSGPTPEAHASLERDLAASRSACATLREEAAKAALETAAANKARDETAESLAEAVRSAALAEAERSTETRELEAKVAALERRARHYAEETARDDALDAARAESKSKVSPAEEGETDEPSELARARSLARDVACALPLVAPRVLVQHRAELLPLFRVALANLDPDEPAALRDAALEEGAAADLIVHQGPPADSVGAFGFRLVRAGEAPRGAPPREDGGDA